MTTHQSLVASVSLSITFASVAYVPSPAFGEDEPPLGERCAQLSSDIEKEFPRDFATANADGFAKANELVGRLISLMENADVKTDTKCTEPMKKAAKMALVNLKSVALQSEDLLLVSSVGIETLHILRYSDSADTKKAAETAVNEFVKRASQLATKRIQTKPTRDEGSPDSYKVLQEDLDKAFGFLAFAPHRPDELAKKIVHRSVELKEQEATVQSGDGWYLDNENYMHVRNKDQAPFERSFLRAVETCLENAKVTSGMLERCVQCKWVAKHDNAQLNPDKSVLRLSFWIMLNDAFNTPHVKKPSVVDIEYHLGNKQWERTFSCNEPISRVTP